MRARWIMALVLGTALLVLLGCRGCTVVDDVRARLSGSPARTDEPTRASPAVEPTASPTTIPAQRIDSLADLPADPGTTFEVPVTEAELNERMRDEVVEREGVTVTSPRVTLAEGEILGAVMVAHEATGVSVQVSFRGQPRVVDGEVLFAVEDVTLDDSVRGVARLLVQGVIDQALAQVGAAEGITLPLEGLDSIEILDVRVEPGLLIVTGRTR